MMKKDRAYILPTTLFIVSLLMTFLMLTFIWVMYYIGRTNKNLKEIEYNNDAFRVLEQVIEIFSDDVKGDVTSPYSEWFSLLPEEMDGFKITYDVEDSKFDINHIDISVIKENPFLKKDKKIGKYLYYPWDLKPFLIDNSGDASRDIFTIYSVPNLNTAKVERIRMYLDSQMIPETISNSVIERINFYRGGKNYLVEKGLLINEDKFLDLRTYFPKNEYERFYLLFDYKGMVNLNFVNKEVFELGIKLCNPPKDDVSSEISRFWPQVLQRHESSSSINSLKEIFGGAENKYEKFFSVDSSLFKLNISGNNAELTAFLRKYKDSLGHIKISVLKTNVKNREFKMPDASEDAVLQTDNFDNL